MDLAMVWSCPMCKSNNTFLPPFAKINGENLCNVQAQLCHKCKKESYIMLAVWDAIPTCSCGKRACYRIIDCVINDDIQTPAPLGPVRWTCEKHEDAGTHEGCWKLSE